LINAHTVMCESLSLNLTLPLLSDDGVWGGAMLEISRIQAGLFYSRQRLIILV